MTPENWNLWLEQPWVQVAIAIFSLIFGSVLTIIVYRLQKHKPKICLHHKLYRLLGYPNQTLPRDIEFQFRGEILTRLEKIILMFWNGGNITISGTDGVAADKFRIEGEFRIIDAKVTKISRTVNNIRLNGSRAEHGAVEIEFDYLDPQDGAVIEILCEGKIQDDEKEFRTPTYKVLGTFRGMPFGFNDRKTSFPMPLVNLVVTISLALFVSALIAVGIYKLVTGEFDWIKLVVIIVAIPIAAVPWLLAIDGFRRYPKALRIPEFVSS